MITISNLKINNNLYDFISNEVLPDTDIEQNKFWNNFAKIVNEFDPINKTLLIKRQDIQNKINQWHKAHKDRDINIEEY